MSSGAVKILSSLAMKEITTPTAIAAYGQIYPKADNNLYFQDGAGTEHLVQLASYGELYFNNNGTAQVIETAGTPIAVRNTTAGTLSGWTRVESSSGTGAITAYADYSGTVAGTVLVTDVAHTLTTGDIISIRGTTNYNGIFSITAVDNDNFYITDTWVADDGASDWDAPDYLLAAATTPTNSYMVSYDLSLQDGGAGGSTISCSIYDGVTQQGVTIARQKTAGTDSFNVSGQGIVTIAASDKIFLAVQSSGTNDVTITYGSITIQRL